MKFFGAHLITSKALPIHKLTLIFSKKARWMTRQKSFIHSKNLSKHVSKNSDKRLIMFNISSRQGSSVHLFRFCILSHFLYEKSCVESNLSAVSCARVAHENTAREPWRDAWHSVGEFNGKWRGKIRFNIFFSEMI